MSEEGSGRLAHDRSSLQQFPVMDDTYRRLFDTLGMGVFRCDARGNALDVSRTALELLGFSASRTTGNLNLFAAAGYLTTARQTQR